MILGLLSRGGLLGAGRFGTFLGLAALFGDALALAFVAALGFNTGTGTVAGLRDRSDG